MAFAGVGASLRAERMRQGLSLADVAKRTRISQKFLTDIEAENFEGLPGTVFARNFVRTYAREIGLDPEPLLAELPAVDIARTPMPNPVARESSRSWDPRMNSVLASMAWAVLAVGAATAAYIHFSKPSHPAAPITAVQPAAAAPKPAPVTPAPVAQVAPPLEVPAVPPHAVEVVLTANQSAWVQITSDGKNDFTGVLNPQETRKIEANELVKLVTGNAGGVSIVLNGKQLDQLGPEGQVRTVRLTAAGPQLVLKTPPPPPSGPGAPSGGPEPQPSAQP